MTTQVTGPGHHVRVNNPLSWYHDCRGVVIGQGRWGYLIVEIVKANRTYRPEIKRGFLEREQEEVSHEQKPL